MHIFTPSLYKLQYIVSLYQETASPQDTIACPMASNLDGEAFCIYFSINVNDDSDSIESFLFNDF